MVGPFLRRRSCAGRRDVTRDDLCRQRVAAGTGFCGKTARNAAQRLLHAASGIDLDEQHLRETSAVESEARLELVVRVS